MRWLVAPVVFLSTVLSLGGSTLSTFRDHGFGFVLGRGVLPSQIPLRFALNGDMIANLCTVPSPYCIVLLNQVLTPADIGSVFRLTLPLPVLTGPPAF